MDLNVFIGLILVCLNSVLGATVETKPRVEGTLLNQVTLTCLYSKAENERLFYMWWYKEDTASKKLHSLASMAATGTPMWDNNITYHSLESFRSRTNLVYVNGDVLQGDAKRYSLSFVTEDLQCADEGTYVCKVLTSTMGNGPAKSKTVLKVVANPGKPSIPIDELELTENSTYKLRCSANVGLPETQLKWYYKTASSDRFAEYGGYSIVDKNESSGCVRTITQHIEFEMTSDQDGAEYRCALADKTSWNNTQKYDRVIIRLKGVATPEPSTEEPCKGSKCNPSPSKDDTGGGKRVTAGFVLLALQILALRNLFS